MTALEKKKNLWVATQHRGMFVSSQLWVMLVPPDTAVLTIEGAHVAKLTFIWKDP